MLHDVKADIACAFIVTIGDASATSRCDRSVGNRTSVSVVLYRAGPSAIRDTLAFCRPGKRRADNRWPFRRMDGELDRLYLRLATWIMLLLDAGLRSDPLGLVRRRRRSYG